MLTNANPSSPPMMRYIAIIKKKTKNRPNIIGREPYKTQAMKLCIMYIEEAIRTLVHIPCRYSLRYSLILRATLQRNELRSVRKANNSLGFSQGKLPIVHHSHYILALLFLGNTTNGPPGAGISSDSCLRACARTRTRINFVLH